MASGQEEEQEDVPVTGKLRTILGFCFVKSEKKNHRSVFLFLIFFVSPTLKSRILEKGLEDCRCVSFVFFCEVYYLRIKLLSTLTCVKIKVKKTYEQVSRGRSLTTFLITVDEPCRIHPFSALCF